MGLRKFLRKAGKVVKKVAPLASLVLGGPAAGGAIGALKLASKLKSAGKAARDVLKPQAPPRVEPPHVTALMNKYSIPTVQPRPIATNGAQRPFRATRTASAPSARRASRSKAKAPTKAQLKGLYQEWLAEGRPGDWQEYARINLN